MEISRFITGWILISISIVLCLVFAFNVKTWPVLIYAIPLFIIGILILNDFGKESKIENIRERNKKSGSNK